MTHRSRQRWRRALEEDCFQIDGCRAVLRSSASAGELRRLVGCPSGRDLQRQLSAGEAEGWLETDPSFVVDLDRLDALLVAAAALSDRAYRAAADDLETLEAAGIAFRSGAEGWLAVDASGRPVPLRALAELFGLSSLGSVQYRVDRMRRSLDASTPPPDTSTMGISSRPEPAATDSERTGALPAGDLVSETGGLGERILGQLENETDVATRRSLAAALASCVASPPVNSSARTEARLATNDVADDSRSAGTREEFATSEVPVVRESPREVLEEVQEHELPIPVLREDSRNTQAVPRNNRPNTAAPDWPEGIAQLEPLIRPLESRVGALGPGARTALMGWSPDEVAHAVGVLSGWVDGGFVLTNPSGYVITACTAGYLALFPLTKDTPIVSASIWKERARQVSPATCVDQIDAAHGPSPGRTYDRPAHLKALAEAASATPAVLDHYSPTDPQTPTLIDVRNALENHS